MRSEQQPHNNIRVTLEIVDNGAGQTGLSPACTIRRTSDGQYLQSGGGWGASPSSIALSEASAANQPGLYHYAAPAADTAPTDGHYWVKIEETATWDVLEYVTITPILPGDDARKLTAATSCMRFIPSAWDTDTGQPTAGTIYYYATEALYDADTTPNGTGAFASEEIEATFSSGQLQVYGRSPT